MIHGSGGYYIRSSWRDKRDDRDDHEVDKRGAADILHLYVVSSFPGTEFYDWRKENGCLLTDDPNEYLDSEGHRR